MRVLLATDGSSSSKHAAEMVKHLAPPVQLHVLHVVDIGALRHSYLASDYSEHDFENYREEVSRLSKEVLHEIRDELGSYTQEIRLIADSGDPAESIIRTAEEVDADLIILGHKGITAKPSFLLGGVSQKIATYAPCSVLICKGSSPVFDRTLIAMDGSDASNKAIEFLATCPFNTPLHVIIMTVWAPPGPGALEEASGSKPLSPETSVAKDKGEQYLLGVADKFREGPYTTQGDWRCGDPPSAILESIQNHNVPMVVVGARGVKGIKRFLLGSVSQKVLMHAPCSVLIVR